MRDVTLNAAVHRGESVRTGPLARVELTMLDETKLTQACLSVAVIRIPVTALLNTQNTSERAETFTQLAC